MRKLSIISPLFLLICITSCDPAAKDQEKEQDQPFLEDSISHTKQGKHLLYVKLKTTLSEEELLAKAHEREPQFAALEGLLQKYYIKINDSTYGGVYIWDSKESMAEYKASELASSIPKAYSASEPPEVEIVDILFSLREDRP